MVEHTCKCRSQLQVENGRPCPQETHRLHITVLPRSCLVLFITNITVKVLQEEGRINRASIITRRGKGAVLKHDQEGLGRQRARKE